MNLNFIRIAINAAKHPQINSIANGLRIIIRLLEIYQQRQREHSLLEGKEATNQWIGNGGLTEYQIKNALDHLALVEIGGKKLIEVDMKFIPKVGKQRTIDLKGFESLDIDYNDFFNRYCKAPVETSQQSNAKKGNKKQADSAEVKSALVKSAYPKPTKDINMNNPLGLFSETSERQDFDKVSYEKGDDSKDKVIEKEPTDFHHTLFKPGDYLFNKATLQKSFSGGCIHNGRSKKPKTFACLDGLPFDLIKMGSASLVCDDQRLIEIQSMLDDLNRFKEVLYKFSRSEQAMFSRIISALVFEHSKEFTFMFVNEAKIKQYPKHIHRPDIEVYFIDRQGIDNEVIQEIIEKEKMTLILD
jgi:hypothetical protein